MGGAVFSPTDLSGLLWWVKADAGVFQEHDSKTTPSGNGNPVGTWEDQSGNAVDFSAPASDNTRPTLVTGVQNGLPGVLGDGVNDEVKSASLAHGIGTGDFYIAIAMQYVSDNGTWAGLWGNGQFVPAIYARGSATQWALYWVAEKKFDTVLSAGTSYLLEVWRDAGTIKAAVNSVQEATTYALATSMGTAIATLFDDGKVGTNEATNSYIFESLFVSDYTSAQQSDIQTYLNNRWSIY